MRLLVFGGRDFSEWQSAFSCLDRIHAKHAVSVVIEGGARGADRTGREWARARGVRVETFPADWKSHGKRAGFLRNQQMLDEGNPDAAIGFPGGRGTADMAARCSAAGIPLWRPMG